VTASQVTASQVSASTAVLAGAPIAALAGALAGASTGASTGAGSETWVGAVSVPWTVPRQSCSRHPCLLGGRSHVRLCLETSPPGR